MGNTQLKVLIVEDHDDFRAAISSVFTQWGFSVRDASGGIAALDLLAADRFDLVLSDVNMPQGDGIWLLEKIREINGFPPVILMSSIGMTEERALKLGAVGFLSKPFSTNCLQKVVGPLLNFTKKASS